MTGLAAALSRDGFGVSGALLDPPELAHLRAAFERVQRRCAEAVGLDRWLELVQQVREPEVWEPAFAALRDDPRLEAVAAEALGRPAEVGWQHLVWRRPRCALRLPWHADFETWPAHVQRRGGVALWLALDDSGPDAGGVRYAPGTQAGLGPEPPEPVCPTVPAGAALVHSGRVLHCSGPNRTDRWRRAVVLVFIATRPAPSPAAPG